ncbi:MAG: prolyl oligopeptidase family serine peptidase [Spirochaetales bacterium]|jgi:cephalosporin-C deacetylase|nr:prolyl oligopeptidase family serine peptidase [Spirochaetales bacterium]
MPLIDMPIEELKTYQGISPKPDDFDTYWTQAIQEMESVDPAIELRKSSFETPFAECYDLFFTGVRNARIHALYIKPNKSTAGHPAVVQFHGYTGRAGDWLDKLPYAAAGFGVFALDCRGQGGLSEDTGGSKGNTHNGHIIRGLDDSPENLLFRQIFLDTAELTRIAMTMDEVDETKVGIMGGSQGGALTVACSSLVPEVNRLAPVFPFLSDYRRVWEMDLAKRAYKELADYFRMFDPRHEREEEIFNTLGYIDIKNLADRIKGEVFWGIGLMDEVCPPSTQFAAYNKIQSNKKMVFYPDFGHENLPGFGDKTFEFMTEMLNR